MYHTEVTLSPCGLSSYIPGLPCCMQSHTCARMSDASRAHPTAWVWMPIFPLTHVLLHPCRRSHHLCEEPDCQGALMAYATEEELAQHRRDRHSRVMPRWQRDTARRVDVDFDVRRRPGTASGPGHGNPQQRARPLAHCPRPPCLLFEAEPAPTAFLPCSCHVGDGAWQCAS